MNAEEKQPSTEPDRVLVPTDPWSSTPTGDEEWEVNYNISENDLWEVTPAE